ncbi:MAG: hypothetical protein WC601_09695 [Desulfotomaculaceae bacterium]
MAYASKIRHHLPGTWGRRCLISSLSPSGKGMPHNIHSSPKEGVAGNITVIRIKNTAVVIRSILLVGYMTIPAIYFLRKNEMLVLIRSAERGHTG